MNNKYVEYLKNNPQGYWFKRKLYGWGWVSVKWEGWAVIAASVGYIVWVAQGFAKHAELAKALNVELASGELTSFFVKIALGVGVMMVFCFWKGESPRWQWGIPKD